jgi:hypothetical protein
MDKDSIRRHDTHARARTLLPITVLGDLMTDALGRYVAGFGEIGASISTIP